MVHESGKVGSSDATPIISFSVDFFDLKFLSFKFGNDTLITLKCQGYPTIGPMGNFAFLLSEVLSWNLKAELV